MNEYKVMLMSKDCYNGKHTVYLVRTTKAKNKKDALNHFIDLYKEMTYGFIYSGIYHKELLPDVVPEGKTPDGIPESLQDEFYISVEKINYYAVYEFQRIVLGYGSLYKKSFISATKEHTVPQRHYVRLTKANYYREFYSLPDEKIICNV